MSGSPARLMLAAEVVAPVLPSRDLGETIIFYRALGFVPARDDHGDYLILVRGFIELHFVLFPEIDPSSSSAMCYVRNGDVDALQTAMAGSALPAEGIPRLSGVRDEPWGMREFHVVDPSGNLLKFGTPLSNRPR